MTEHSHLRIDKEPPSSEILNQVADNIPIDEIESPAVQAIIDRMFDYAYGRQGSNTQRTVVGLASPQLGISKRVILVATSTPEPGEQPDLNAYINPVVSWFSPVAESWREGCESTDMVCGIVERSKAVIFTAYDRHGSEVGGYLEGFLARVLQHEVDHLNGIRFPDRITDDDRLHWVEKEQFGDYREHWQNWAVLCPRDKWEAIKSGRE